ncbi:hypothetical protein [Brachyspira sp.]|nr:hypothetical protein [Brachyspira sp.]
MPFKVEYFITKKWKSLLMF